MGSFLTDNMLNLLFYGWLLFSSSLSALWYPIMHVEVLYCKIHRRGNGGSSPAKVRMVIELRCLKQDMFIHLPFAGAWLLLCYGRWCQCAHTTKCLALIICPEASSQLTFQICMNIFSFFQSSLFIIACIIVAQSPSVVMSYKFNKFVFSWALKAIYMDFPFILCNDTGCRLDWESHLVSFIIE